MVWRYKTLRQRHCSSSTEGEQTLEQNTQRPRNDSLNNHLTQATPAPPRSRSPFPFRSETARYGDGQRNEDTQRPTSILPTDNQLRMNTVIRVLPNPVANDTPVPAANPAPVIEKSSFIKKWISKLYNILKQKPTDVAVAAPLAGASGRVNPGSSSASIFTLPRTWLNRHQTPRRPRLSDRPATPAAAPVPPSSTEDSSAVSREASADAEATSDYKASFRCVAGPIPHHWRVAPPVAQITPETLALRQLIAESLRNGDVFDAREGWFDPDAPEEVLQDWRLQHKALVEDHDEEDIGRGGLSLGVVVVHR
ncbi:hypothetical protein CFE70_010010 [Pyrenophora teres f. teres 0-1]